MRESNKYDGLFAISPIKRITLLPDGRKSHKTVKQKDFNALRNENVYDKDGKLIEIADQTTYNTAFVIRLSRIYINDLTEFLDYHFRRTSNEDKYLNLLEFGMVHDKHISIGIQQGIAHWVKRQRNKKEWRIDKHNPLENLYHWEATLMLYFKAVFTSGPHKIRTLSRKLQDNEEKSIEKIIFKAEREIEALYLNVTSLDVIIRVVKPKFDYFLEFAQSLIDQYKMNHVDNTPKYKSFFHATQRGLWDFYDWYRHLIGEIDLNNIDKQPQPPKQIELKDFFKDHIEKDKIYKIETAYKGVRGKKMAMLIYLLQSEFEVIEIYFGSKTNSRSHFVKCLTGMNKTTMQGINKYFISATDSLRISNEDPELNTLKTELNALLN